MGDQSQQPGTGHAVETNEPLSGTQKRALTAAWLGWAFDGLDSYLFIAVALPLVKRLLAASDPLLTDDALQADAITKASLIQAVFFVGWALGGAIFGRLGDRIGRTKVLCLTVLTYAVFTGLGFFATEWWHLLIFRFLAALGIGGEWAAGSSLVSEVLQKRHRVWASALLQSGYVLGVIAATASAGLFDTAHLHYVFLVGVAPAFFVLWIRSSVPEPESWHEAKAAGHVPRVSELFAPGLAMRTIVLTTFIAIALVTVWVFLFFMPHVIDQLGRANAWTADEIRYEKTRCALIYLTVNLLSNFVATYAAEHWGHRRAFLIFCAGALASALVFFREQPQSLTAVYAGACGMSFFALGLFAMFPMYIPPLFPTLLRTLGSGFAYNVGRIVTAGGTIVAGGITKSPGGPAAAIWWMAMLYVPAILLTFILPVTPAEEPRRDSAA